MRKIRNRKEERRIEMKGRLSLGWMIVVAALVAVSLGNSLQAQSIWIDRSARTSFAIEYLKPSFHEGYLAGSMAAFMSAHTRVSPNAAFIVELPYAHSNEGGGYYYGYGDGDQEDAVGNLYIGAEILSNDGRFSSEFGIRLPTAPEESWEAKQVGYLTDFDHLEAFLHDWITISMVGNLHYNYNNGYVGRLRLGPSIVLPTGDLSGEDTEVMLHYSYQIWHESDRARIGAGITGVWSLTNEDEDLFSGENIEHQFTVAANLKCGTVCPGLLLRMPLSKDLSTIYDYVLGLNVQVNLK
jgi:hypothetical protein